MLFIKRGLREGNCLLHKNGSLCVIISYDMPKRNYTILQRWCIIKKCRDWHIMSAGAAKATTAGVSAEDLPPRAAPERYD